MICDFTARLVRVAATPSTSLACSLCAAYRWPHGSRRRAQLRHLLEFHSTLGHSISVALCLSPSLSVYLSLSLPLGNPFAILIHLCFVSAARPESQMSKTCKLYASRSQPTQTATLAATRRLHYFCLCAVCFALLCLALRCFCWCLSSLEHYCHPATSTPATFALLSAQLGFWEWTPRRLFISHINNRGNID